MGDNIAASSVAGGFLFAAMKEFPKKRIGHWLSNPYMYFLLAFFFKVVF